MSVPWTQDPSGLRTLEFTPKPQFFEHLHRVKFCVEGRIQKFRIAVDLVGTIYMLLYVQCKICIIEFFCFLGDENSM